MASSSKKKNVARRKNRADKIHLVFDEEKRKEFLTGFRKRKLQRKKKAQEEFEKQLKEEKKRLKAEAKESYKKLVTSFKPIPEVEHLLSNEYEEDDTTVKIFELSTNEIAKQNNWIGANEPKYATYENESEENTLQTDNEENEEDIPGMELKSKKEPQRHVKVENKIDFESERDLKKTLKKTATKNVKGSKIFQRKNKMERQKQKKKALQQKNLKIKFNRRHKKKGKRKQNNR